MAKRRNKMRKIVYWCVSIGLIAFIIVIGIVNLIKNTEFWTSSISQVITLLIAIIITLYATQYKNDQRKAKDYAENVIRKIQNIVNDEKFIIFTPNIDKLIITMSNRKLSNYTSILKAYGKKLGFSEEAKYIEEEFQRYRTFVDDHITDIEYLKKSTTTLQNYADNIEQKCEHIILNLYK